MDDPVIWIIIIAFYAPLHFMLPVLFLFIVGGETEAVRKQLIRRALIDAALSMVVAFLLAIMLVNYSQIGNRKGQTRLSLSNLSLMTWHIDKSHQ